MLCVGALTALAVVRAADAYLAPSALRSHLQRSSTALRASRTPSAWESFDSDRERDTSFTRAVQERQTRTEEGRSPVAEVADLFGRYAEKLKELPDKLEADGLREKLRANVWNKTSFGEGEAWAFLQVFGVLAVIIGKVPVVGDFMEYGLGPSFISLGLLFILTGVLEMGEDISPWPQPIQGATLKKEGIYKYVRHPMYSGLLIASFGLALATKSIERLVLCGLLFWILENKANYEERQLVDTFQDYEQYAQETNKFFPFIY
mmetsp:Transcript_24916/g.61648  ORF Transcript_24916/g.61648 Transcript_24916/m.61648 type:complete len:262 (-) Transcript_24916:854-1639(-)